MSESDKNLPFSTVLAEALKQMQETATTAVSSSYEVVRSSGEVIVRRADKNWSDSNTTEQPLKKVA